MCVCVTFARKNNTIIDKFYIYKVQIITNLNIII